MLNITNKIKHILGKTKNYSLFQDREQRAKFISKIFKNFLKGTILDVGCSESFLKKYLPSNIKYIGVDISGNPDYIIDLEKQKLEIFEDNSFDVVICTEVLEHLENLHEVFDDLCRVSKRYIIISLPNNWVNFKYYLISGKGYEKFYSLPIENPIDRHKWFFNYEEAYKFLIKRGKKNNFKLKYHFPVPFVYNSIKNQLFNVFFKIYYNRRFSYNNLYYISIWALLEKEKNVP